ncbi:HepT-like ribonuclease domain-containing protein [Methanoculleus horonobensis]|uniref:HepT-like ribonuclease domain-containing protein n=1 Tax=Methanoculleus horonobensis TaxID=528314 RepID=UPI00083664A3|nr:HepT-like ribonuclease domain-containing protein [Methanoculleus horonobensis]MDD3070403.1 DUF86 domain-containing protein [Methanoculleus horonobensis]MDD4252033.1 DUF86 domain-containing protein [Methanoculleus horonobensis]
MKDATLYLLHIRECTDRIMRYTHDGKMAFLADEMIQDAVLRNLQILAESTQRLDEDLKASHPEIDWHGISGFRNILAHQYLSVNPLRIWNVIEQHLPLLLEAVTRMLEEKRDG